MARVISKTSARKAAAKKTKATAATKSSAGAKKVKRAAKSASPSGFPKSSKAPKSKSSTKAAKAPAKTTGAKTRDGAKKAEPAKKASARGSKSAAEPAGRRTKAAPEVVKPLLEAQKGAGPNGADRESLKARFAALRSATSEITGMKRAINKNFFDVGVILNKIRSERLYEVKGYGSFESFVERELDLSKLVCLRSARIAESLRRDVALEAGLERASAAVAVLDGEEPDGEPAARPAAAVGMSTLPRHKQ